MEPICGSSPELKLEHSVPGLERVSKRALRINTGETQGPIYARLLQDLLEGTDGLPAPGAVPCRPGHQHQGEASMCSMNL